MCSVDTAAVFAWVTGPTVAILATGCGEGTRRNLRGAMTCLNWPDGYQIPQQDEDQGEEPWFGW